MSLTLGEKIKTARKDAGYTQEQLAVMLTVSRQAIKTSHKLSPLEISREIFLDKISKKATYF